VQNLMYESDRRIQVEWGKDPDTQRPTTYPVKLTVICEDRSGMLKEFTAIIADDGTNIRSSNTSATPEGNAVVEFVIETVDMRHLNKLTQSLRRVPGVIDVQRVQKV
jgi:GTP pyrophosphokinase